MQHLVELVSHRMTLGNLSSRRMLVDLGGGTGNFAKELVERNDNLHITVVEPFLDQGTNGNNSERISFVQESADIFLCPESWRDKMIHQILLKELVHHLNNRDELFRGIYDSLIPLEDEDTPSILIITRPQTDIDYPFWDAARQVWAANQPGSAQIQSELQRAGFINIQQTTEVYECQILLAKWQDMVKKRFWSTFSHFTDEELQQGCTEIEKERPPDDKGLIYFQDRVLFITASKKS